MEKLQIVFIGTLLFLVACAAGADGAIQGDESTEDDGVMDDVTAVPVLATLASTTVPEKPATPGETETAAAAVTTNAVVPVTVDLSQLTPAATAVDSTPQVIPAPGLPNPLTALVSQVSQHLAQRLEIDVSQVTLVQTQAVEWRDSSLGCPQPGMGYLTVITPGYLITLTAQAEEYFYHTDQRANFVLCGEDGRPLPG